MAAGPHSALGKEEERGARGRPGAALVEKDAGVQDPQAAQRGLWRNAAAGVSGGFVSTMCLHPLDVVNTRLQVQDGRLSQLPIYRSTLHGLRSIAQTEGVACLYAGDSDSRVSACCGCLRAWP